MLDCQPSLFAWGNASIAWIAEHIRAAWLTPIMIFFTELGQVGAVLFTTALSYWLWQKRYARALCYGLFANLFLNLFVKNLVRECRPPEQYWLENVSDSYSFPSGHAQVGVFLWFGFAFYCKKTWQRVICLLIGLLIALSRPYLGVHYPQDIAMGAILGITVAALSILCQRKNIAFLASCPLLIRGIVLLLVMVCMQFIIQDPRHAEVSVIGATLGYWFGCQLEYKYLDFKPARTAGLMIMQLIIGAIGIFVFWKGGDWLRKHLNDALSLNMKYLQYFLLGLWISFLAPMLVLKQRKTT